MKLYSIVMLGALSAVACDKHEENSEASEVAVHRAEPGTASPTARDDRESEIGANIAKDGDDARVAADNTGKNERDRDDATLTPLDQGNSEADVQTTQKIRQAVMGNDALSTTAKNVKIITNGGQVTLRGPVDTDQERAVVEKAARDVAGSGKVVNQLEVKK